MLEQGIARASMHYGRTFAAQDVLVIGDTVRDIAAASEVGARMLAVSTGAGQHGELRAARPDWLIADLREMPELR